jgi:hypothetical protein
MLSTVGSVGFFISVLVYKKWFTKTEVRTLTKWAIFIDISGGIFTLLFVLRVNLKLGIPDIAFVFVTETVTQVIVNAFTLLP